MSGTSIAMPQTTGINLENPAMWANNTDTRIQLGYKFNQSLVSDGNNDLFQNYGSFDGLMALFNIDTALGLSASVGFYGYSNVNNYVSSPVFVEKDEQLLTGRSLYEGAGGITRAYFGASVSPLDFLSVGAKIFTNSGVIENIVQTEFDQGFAFSSNTTKSDAVGGVGYRFGANVNPISTLNIGMFYEPEATLDIESTVTYGSVFSEDTSFTGNNTYQLPASFGMGISYLTGKFLIGLDYQTSDFTGFSYNVLQNVTYNTYTNISLGVVRVGNRSRFADALDQFSYRFGIAYKDLYYSVGGTDIDEISGSFGVTMPIKGTAEIDFGISIGRRGNTSESLISETFGKLSVNISIGDTWFQPFERDYE